MGERIPGLKEPSQWTPERERMLRERWAAGTPASAIAKELGTNKNAVIGKAHRLKLERRNDPVKKGASW